MLAFFQRGCHTSRGGRAGKIARHLRPSAPTHGVFQYIEDVSFPSLIHVNLSPKPINRPERRAEPESFVKCRTGFIKGEARSRRASFDCAHRLRGSLRSGCPSTTIAASIDYGTYTVPFDISGQASPKGSAQTCPACPKHAEGSHSINSGIVQSPSILLRTGSVEGSTALCSTRRFSSEVVNQ